MPSRDYERRVVSRRHVQDFRWDSLAIMFGFIISPWLLYTPDREGITVVLTPFLFLLAFASGRHALWSFRHLGYVVEYVTILETTSSELRWIAYVTQPRPPGLALSISSKFGRDNSDTLRDSVVEIPDGRKVSLASIASVARFQILSINSLEVHIHRDGKTLKIPISSIQRVTERGGNIDGATLFSPVLELDDGSKHTVDPLQNHFAFNFLRDRLCCPMSHHRHEIPVGRHLELVECTCC